MAGYYEPLVLSPDAEISPYIGEQIHDGGFWNHQNNGVHMVMDPSAQAWAAGFDWLGDAKARFKKEMAQWVIDRLTHTDAEASWHRLGLRAMASPWLTFQVPDGQGGYTTETGTEIVAGWHGEWEAWENRVHNFAANLITMADAATNMTELRAVRDIEAEPANWPV